MTDDSPKNMKKCFVIGPIGKAGSDTRNKADYLLEYIIKPAVSEHGYVAFRSDEVTESGLITNQVIIDTIESDLVIADLTSHNANAFYELGIRHTGSNKPTIHMILDGQEPPFDVKDHRYISYSLNNPKDITTAAQKLSDFVGSLSLESEIHNPVTKAMGIKELASSKDSKDQIIAIQNNRLDRLERDISQLKLSNPDIAASMEYPESYLPRSTFDELRINARMREQSLESKHQGIGGARKRLSDELGLSYNDSDSNNIGLSKRKKDSEE
ncbi:MAG: hypothetical protein AB2563_03485 [Candidatus Thiodiazotropha endolucinida]